MKSIKSIVSCFNCGKLVPEEKAVKIGMYATRGKYCSFLCAYLAQCEWANLESAIEDFKKLVESSENKNEIEVFSRDVVCADRFRNAIVGQKICGITSSKIYEDEDGYRIVFYRDSDGKQPLPACPICSSKDISKISDDFSIIEKEGKKVILKGEIKHVYTPEKANCSPFGNLVTLILYDKKKKPKYLNFKTKEDVDKLKLKEGALILCEGCLHKIDGKDVIFEVKNVKFL